MKKWMIVGSVSVCFLFAGFAAAQPSQNHKADQVQSPSIWPSYFENLPRTKAGLKRFLVRYCAEHLPSTAIRIGKPGMRKYPFNILCVGPKSYHLCRALAQGNVSECNALKGVCDPQTVKSCVRAYYGLASFMELKKNPAVAESLCEKSVEESHLPISKGSISRMCRALNKGVLSSQSPDEVCGKIITATPGLPSDFSKGCRHEMRFLSGVQSCSQSPAHVDSSDGICEAKAGIVRATSSGVLSECGSSVICRAALSHSVETCQLLKEKTVQDYCVESAAIHSSGLAHQAPQSHSMEVCRPSRDKAIQDYCVESAANQFSRMKIQESIFRKYNHLPPYQDGDKFLNFLPPQGREKYYDKKRMREHEQIKPKHISTPPLGNSSTPDSGE